MNIVHLDFTGPFTDEAAYQENILPSINVMDGHNVTFLTEKTKWMNGQRVYLKVDEPCDYQLKNGVRVIRLEYRKILSRFFSDKIRAPKKLKYLLDNLKPDVIFLHCLQTWATIPVCKYVQANSNVKLFIDSHSDKYNSGKGFLSKYILHGFYYKGLAKYGEKFAEKIFYISIECKDFLIERYHLHWDKLEFMPLGGIPVTDEIKKKHRMEFRNTYSISDDEIVLIHAGKMDKLKKTLEILLLFNNFKSDKMRLILVGTFSEEISEQAQRIIDADERIIYVGWKSADQLESYLCGADLYLQPGSQSSTAQHAMCCGLPVILANVESYRFFVKNNGWLVDEVNEISDIFYIINKTPKILKEMSKESKDISIKYLDYREQAKKFT